MTKIFVISLILGLLLSFVLFMNANTHAYTNLGGGVCTCNSCSDCNNALNDLSCSEVKLISNLYLSSDSNCIDNPTNFNNKIFDCQGNSIDGQTYEGNGIYLSSKNNNLIKNCIIKNFGYPGFAIGKGILLETCSNITLFNNSVNENSNDGFYLFNSFNNELINNTANSNYEYGIHLVMSNGNELINNTANSNTNGVGIYLESSSNNNLIKNNLDSNYYGIYLDTSSNNNNLTNNTAISNMWAAFYLRFSNENILIENEAISNYFAFYLESASDTILIKNQAISNLDGFQIYSGSNNNITGNNATLNSRVGFYIQGGTNNNKFKDNIANSNGEDGFILYSAVDNNFINNTANSNNLRGFIIYEFSSNNNFTDSIVNSNEYGFFIIRSDNNQIKNCNLNFNNYGIYFIHDSSNNEIFNCTISNNNIGIKVSSNSGPNTLTNFETYSNTISDFEFSSGVTTNLINYTLGTPLSHVFFTSLSISDDINLSNSKIKYSEYFFSLNSYLNDPFNTTTNISLNVSNCSTSYDIYKKEAFPQYLEDILQNGTLYNSSWKECSGNIFKFTVDSFSGYGIKEFDNEVPNINFKEPTPLNGASYAGTWIEVNATSSDPNLKNTTIYLYNSIGTLLDLKTTISNNSYKNFTNLSIGIYYINATACDTFNNCNSTETRSITLLAEQVQQDQGTKENNKPSISFVSSTQGFVSQNYIDAVLSATDSDGTISEISVYLFKDGVLQNSDSCSSSPCTANFTSLNDGNYQINATATDNKGAIASTSTRTAILDKTDPEIEFVSPTPVNGATINTENVIVSTSSEDLNYEKTIIKLLIATTTINTYQCNTLQCSKGYNLGNGNFSIVATAYDTALNSKEIYREFEVYVSSIAENATQNQTMNETMNQTIEMNETESNQTQAGEEQGIEQGETSETGTQGEEQGTGHETGSGTGTASQGNEGIFENLLISENSPVASIVVFATSNPLVIAIPSLGLLAILYLNKDKLLPH